MIPSFIESRLLDDVAYGFSGGPVYNTLVTTMPSGITRRKIMRTRPIHRFSASFDKRDDGVLEAILEAYHATYGAAVGFRFKNWLDYQASDEVIGVGTGATQSLQLTKTMQFGTSVHVIPIKKPVFNTVQLTASNAPIAATINSSTGVATFVAPAGHVVRWSGEYDLPVRFESDEFSAIIDTYNTHTIDMQLVEDLSA
jgi:uncharacterized protein (TIGR02217 family)